MTAEAKEQEVIMDRDQLMKSRHSVPKTFEKPIHEDPIPQSKSEGEEIESRGIGFYLFFCWFIRRTLGK